MKKLVSLLLAVCLLIPCAFAETAETAASAMPEALSIVLSDAYFTYAGEKYPLNPTLALNASMGGESTLIDFYIESDGSNLFPIQMKLSEEGFALLIGTSKNVYLFDALLISDMLGITGQDIGISEYFAMADPYGDLEAACYEAVASEPMDPNAVEAFLAALETIEGRSAGEAGTVEVDGTVCDATVYSYSFDYDGYQALGALSDPLLGKGFWDANLQLLLFSEGIDESITRSEADRRLYSDISAEAREYRLTGSDTVVMERDITTVRADTGESEVRTIRYTLYGPEHILYEQITENARRRIERTPGKAHIEDTFSDPYTPYIEITTILVNEAGGFDTFNRLNSENTIIGMTEATIIDMHEAEEEFSIESSYLCEYDDGSHMDMAMSISGTNEYQASGTFDIILKEKILGTEEDAFIDIAMGSAVSIEPAEALNDRITGAKVTTISTEEDLTGSSGLMLALMGLMGDAERLMNEDSVAAMLEGIEAASAKMTEEYTYDYGEYEGIEIPTVNVPDSFELVDGTQLYGYDSILDTSVYRDGTDLLSVTIAADTALKSYLDANLSEEEAAAPSLPRDVSVDIRENYARAIVLHDEYTIVIEAFNGAADYALLGQLIADIEFPVEEKTSEEEPVPAPVPGGGKGIKGGHTL